MTRTTRVNQSLGRPDDLSGARALGEGLSVPSALTSRKRLLNRPGGCWTVAMATGVVRFRYDE
jgi:hypothetical protein